MKTRFSSLLIKTILVGILIAGIFLLLISLQSYDNLAPLFNRLATDGNFESFTGTLYQRLRIPSVLAGISLMVLAGFLLIQWKKTETQITFRIQTVLWSAQG